ncbi:MAG: hypothetical protein Q8M76_11615, partial [Spirochaetaceae bacterium]|nr:hypothetical protein [Spirochaetaceae bacterium]
MTAPFPSLVRFYVTSLYGIAGIRRAGPARPKADIKKILKTIGIAVLAALVVGDVGVIFGAMNFATYEALKPAGLQGFLLLNAATTTSLLVFMIGFITALSTYCASRAETYLLALPIAPRPLLAAKMIMVY